ncbi:MAG: NTP transferase domain-containing protein [Alphaproteobacteria bacterium GM202ARS2]|nr:NTP transferase domain-containing protein [Alphaproteobacteria bacterium GM202ARS2]
MTVSLKTAIFPMAGRASRLMPLTKAVNKALLPIYDKPLLHWALNEARACGIERFVFVVNEGDRSPVDYVRTDENLLAYFRNKKDQPQAEAMVDFLQDLSFFERRATLVAQKTPKGLGDAVLCAADYVEGMPFAVILVDDFIYSAKEGCLQQLQRGWQTQGGAWVALQEVAAEDVHRYGIMAVDEDKREQGNDKAIGYRAAGIVEKPSVAAAPSRLAVVGRYILPFEIMGLLRQTQVGAGGEVQLTDALAAYRQEGGALYGLPFTGRRFDCGCLDGWREANRALGGQ